MDDRTFDLFGMPVFADVSDKRAQALKVLEESSELCESAKICSSHRYDDYYHHVLMLDEFADVIQTLQNFAACFEITYDEVIEALDRCVKRNKERGRY